MTKGTTSARLSGGQQYEAGSPMHVLICGALPSGRRWSTALAVDNNEGYRRGLWPAARPAVTALTFKRLIRGKQQHESEEN